MTPKSILRYFTGGVRVQVEAHLALMHSLKRRNKPWLAKLVANRMQRRFLIFVSHRADLHPGVEFRHPTGIVIGDGVKVGKGSVIYQNVTLGGARSGDAALNAYPQVGENVTIFAGAVLVGNISIGDNCTIGANAVVTKDIPANATAAGVPARIVRKT